MVNEHDMVVGVEIQLSYFRDTSVRMHTKYMVYFDNKTPTPTQLTYAEDSFSWRSTECTTCTGG